MPTVSQWGGRPRGIHLLKDDQGDVVFFTVVSPNWPAEVHAGVVHYFIDANWPGLIHPTYGVSVTRQGGDVEITVAVQRQPTNSERNAILRELRNTDLRVLAAQLAAAGE